MLACLIPTKDCPYESFIFFKHFLDGLYSLNVFFLPIRKPCLINLSFIFTVFSYFCWQDVHYYLCKSPTFPKILFFLLTSWSQSSSFYFFVWVSWLLFRILSFLLWAGELVMRDHLFVPYCPKHLKVVLLGYDSRPPMLIYKP